MAVKDVKKQIPLRVSAKLFDELAAWAEDDFRSINGQIEYLLTDCVQRRKRDLKHDAMSKNDVKDNSENL